MGAERIVWLLAGLLVLVVLLVVLRRRHPGGDEPGSVDEVKRLRAETALSELRDMREALGPAEHSRVERRRNPQPGSAPKIERRRKGARRGAE